MGHKSLIVQELKEHWPLALIASMVAAVVAILLPYFAGAMDFLGQTFEVFHPAHVLVSAAATSAIYHKYRKSVFNGILIGIVGAILIGTLSDVILPWAFGNLFSLQTSFHLPLFEEPWIILGVALIGALSGIYIGLFKINHSLHVFLSVFASLFYILAFSIKLDVWAVLVISIVVFLIVYVPCCISDIVFPLWFIRKR